MQVQVLLFFAKADSAPPETIYWPWLIVIIWGLVLAWGHVRSERKPWVPKPGVERKHPLLGTYMDHEHYWKGVLPGGR